MRAGRVTKPCGICGKLFVTYLCRSKTNRGKYCSLPCRDKSKSAITLERFMRLVGKKLPSGCIPWKGCQTPQGYGLLMSKKRHLTASRVAYELFVEPIPKGMLILHSCDNPLCVCPTHLRAGTQKENVDDCVSKKRHWSFTSKRTEIIRKIKIKRGYLVTN